MLDFRSFVIFSVKYKKRVSSEKKKIIMILYIFKLFLTKNFKIIYYTSFKYCKSDKLQIHDLQEQTKRGIHSYGLRNTTSTMFLPQTNIFFLLIYLKQTKKFTHKI